MSALPHYSEPDGLDPAVQGQVAEIVQEQGYDDAVREFRSGVKNGSAFEGAVSTREEIKARLDRYR